MTAPDSATLTYEGKSVSLPVINGEHVEKALDVRKLRAQTGWITLDPGYANTAVCKSAITHIDGEKGVVLFRGYDLEELTQKSTFVETAMLVMFGELPTSAEREAFRVMLRDQELLHEDLLSHLDGFPPNGHPMAILSAMINAMGSYYPELYDISSQDDFRLAAAKIMSKVRTIAAFSFRKSQGMPLNYPNPKLDYCRNFLHMMFSVPFWIYEAPDPIVRALSIFMMCHADQALDTSCATVRMVGSSQANLFASVSAGICALWGRHHGGASSAAIRMFEDVVAGRTTVTRILEAAKARSGRLMGFGQRVFHVEDPRARIIKATYEKLIATGYAKCDAFHDIAQEIEERAGEDEYFASRHLLPNTNFYSSLLLRAINFPPNMYPVITAIGNMPGWIAHWKEETHSPDQRIQRPRQIYIGRKRHSYTTMEKR
ncbi:Citrate (Si)-synthase [Solidesulfovibrio fructosivorans JJ]]|uniref:Citrate synthase n=1 Tax=Solidesulfovibrio fructosivorans JJ] TaxID=596151 RepID=E1JWC6_SOLFR|nr:citrate/2-methylcitrate synthase [Solidesulfovibrio fructosivorans]EFL51223.1 Citrate (Si)-synthase [Solidesulfovibrio fructosivorans JJ]]